MVCIGRVEDYVQTILNAPKALDFKLEIDGSTRQLYELLRAGVALFRNPLEYLPECEELVGVAITCLNNYINLPPPNIVDPRVITTRDTLVGVQSTLNMFNTHVENNIITPLNTNPGFLSQLTTHLNIAPTMNNDVAGLDNVCEELYNSMGSVLGKGGQKLQALADLLNPLLAVACGAIEDLLEFLGDDANEKLDPINNATNEIAEMVTDEESALADILKEIVDFTHAQMLVGLIGHPCVQAIFNATGTNVFLNSVPQLPRFP